MILMELNLMPATKNKKVSPPKRGKRPSPTKSTKQNEEKMSAAVKAVE